MEQGYEENGGKLYKHTQHGVLLQKPTSRGWWEVAHISMPTLSHREAHQGPQGAGLIGLYPTALLLTMKAEHGPTIGCCTLVSPKNASGKDWYLSIIFGSVIPQHQEQGVSSETHGEKGNDPGWVSTWPFLRLVRRSMVWVILRIHKTHISG